jgi:Di-haem oxidoreductase, putative peroxidase
MTLRLWSASPPTLISTRLVLPMISSQNRIPPARWDNSSGGITLQTTDDPEDTVDSSGRADIDRFTEFMRGLQPPPVPQTASAQAGQQLFNQMGCAGCHTPSITTASNPASFLTPTINGSAVSTKCERGFGKCYLSPIW